MTLAEIATFAVLLAYFLGLAGAVLICTRPCARRCAACARRFGGRRRPAKGAR